MNTDAGSRGIGNSDHIGVLDIFMVQHIQYGDSYLEMVALYAMSINKSHIRSAISSSAMVT